MAGEDIERRYQVFVSSTYEDLQKERQEVMHALLELDCMPSGMELFPAANEEQWELIKQVIDDCDYYIVIIAGRYGSVDEAGTSYTEKEYRYAIDTGKPIIAFLHKDPEQLTTKRTEKTEVGRKRLAQFRELAQKKMCKHWSTADDLGSVVSRSIVRLMKQHPAVGWVRGDTVSDREAAAEILRLQMGMRDLENQLDRAKTGPPAGTDKLSQGSDEFQFRLTLSGESRFTYEDSTLDWKIIASWDDIFAAVSPTMIHEASDGDLRTALQDFARRSAGESDEYEPFASALGRIRAHVNDEDYATIKIQLRALGLISQSERQRSVKDTTTYWTLTPFGDTYMTRLRAIVRDTPAKSDA